VPLGWAWSVRWLGVGTYARSLPKTRIHRALDERLSFRSTVFSKGKSDGLDNQGLYDALRIKAVIIECRIVFRNAAEARPACSLASSSVMRHLFSLAPGYAATIARRRAIQPHNISRAFSASFGSSLPLASVPLMDRHPPSIYYTIDPGIFFPKNPEGVNYSFLA
jgi:hypothetical protein